MDYDIKQYRKDFCKWAAFRAAQARGLNVKREEFISALKASGLIEFLDDPSNAGCDKQRFDKSHRDWVSSIRDHIRFQYKKGISYGIAAKLVAIFIKGYFILAGKEETPLAKVAHPPIDSYLLKGIDEQYKTNLSNKYKWSKLDEEKYLELLSELRKINGDQPFWKLERYWKLPDI